MGMQTFNTTPNGFSEAWLLKCPDEKAREQDDVQSIRNSRKKSKRESETGMGARVSLARRAESLGVGSAEGMKPKGLSQVVLRAERRTNERVHAFGAQAITHKPILMTHSFFDGPRR